MARPRNPDKVLLEFYKEAMEKLARSVEVNVFGVPASPRHLVLLAEARRIIVELDKASELWANQLVRKAYDKNVKFVNDFLRAKGFSRSQLNAARDWAVVHEEEIALLLNDPTNGITPRLKRVSKQLGQSIETYVAQNKLLLRQNRLIRENVAMNVFMGEGSGAARNEILDAMLAKGKPPKSFMGLDSWRGGQAARSLIEAPYLTVVTKNGPRRMHIFDHVQMTATTTENQIRTTARNNRTREMGITLVRITPNPPLTPCVCSLFAGRVFALDPDTAQKTGFPLLSNTPNGGPPFHPYCTHSTMPFIPAVESEAAVKDSMKNGDKKGTRTLRGGLPKALEGTNFTEAQRYFNKRGGIGWAARQNPQIRSYSGSKMADPEVLRALKGRKKRLYRVNDGTNLGGMNLPGPSSQTGADLLEGLE